MGKIYLKKVKKSDPVCNGCYFKKSEDIYLCQSGMKYEKYHCRAEIYYRLASPSELKARGITKWQDYAREGEYVIALRSLRSDGMVPDFKEAKAILDSYIITNNLGKHHA